MEPGSGFSVGALGRLGFAVRPSEDPEEGSRSRGEAEDGTDDREPGASAQPPVRPVTDEEGEENAQTELETDGAVIADSLPVLLHEQPEALAA